MTTHHDLPDDELASAHLDGELSADALASSRQADEPAFLARVEEFRAVSEMVSSGTAPVAEVDAERVLAAAMRAAEDLTSQEGDGSAPASAPLSIEASRRRRSASGRAPRKRIWLPPPAAAAAVVVVLALVGIGLIVNGTRSDSGSSSDAASDSGSAKAAESLATERSSTAGDVQVPDLGAFDDGAALAQVLAAADVTTLRPGATAAAAVVAGDEVPPAAETAPTTAAPSPTTSAQPPSTGTQAEDAGSTAAGSATPSPSPEQLASFGLSAEVIERCDTVVRASDASLGPRLAVATATIGDQRVLVYSHPVEAAAGGPPTTRITAAEAQSCAVLQALQR